MTWYWCWCWSNGSDFHFGQEFFLVKVKVKENKFNDNFFSNGKKSRNEIMFMEKYKIENWINEKWAFIEFQEKN